MLVSSPVISKPYLADNVVFKHHFEATVDGQYLDASGNGNHAKIFGDSYAITAGAQGNGIEFLDGLTYLEIPLGDFNPTEFTVSWRLKISHLETEGNGYNQQIGSQWGQFHSHSSADKQNGAHGGRVQIGTLRDDRLNSADTGAQNGYILNEWVHITATQDIDGLFSYYKDGVLIASKQMAASEPWGTFTVGKKNRLSAGMYGTLDELYLYDIAMTAEQVAMLHNFEELDRPPVEHTSALWGYEGELWQPTNRLPFVALAGYQEGKDPIPDDLPIVANIMDFGAKSTYEVEADTAALLAAVAFAETQVNADNQGVLWIPEGEYRFDQPLIFTQPGLVIRGAGQDKTTLYFEGGMVDHGGTINDFMITMGQKQSYQRWNNAFSFGLNNEDLPQRGDFEIRLADAISDDVFDRIAAQGYRIRLAQQVKYGENSESPNLAAEINGTSMPLPNSSGGMLLKQNFIVEISEDRKTLTLDRPLMWTVTDEEIYGGARMMTREFPGSDSQRMGIEQLAIHFDSTKVTGHSGSAFGQGGIYMAGDNSWVKDVYIFNSDNPIAVGKNTHNNQIEGITLDADREPRLSGASGKRYNSHGHHGITTRGESTLVRDITVLKEFTHDITIVNCLACVISEVDGGQFNMDHHRQVVYSSLWTDISIQNPNRMWLSTGNMSEGQASGAYTTYWNIYTAEPTFIVPFPQDENTTRRQWGFLPINMMGVNTTHVPAVGETNLPWPYDATGPMLETITAQDIYPQNIYEAQKKSYFEGKLHGMTSPQTRYSR